MCETRRDLKIARNEYKATKTTDAPQSAEPKMPRQRAPREVSPSDAKETTAPRQRKTYAPRARGEGPREASSDKKEWTLVTKNGPRKVQGRPPRQGSTVITIESK